MRNFARVRQLHEKLLNIVGRDRHAITRDPETRRHFESELRNMIESMEEISGTLNHLDEYEWLNDAVLKWRKISADVLDAPLRVKLQAPAGGMTAPSIPRNDRAPREFEQWLDFLAHETWKDRVLTRYYSRSTREILDSYGHSSGAEKEWDWSQARAWLGRAVLNGDLNFAEQFNPDTYHFLQEGCWLTEIKRAAAYSYWLERRGGWDDGYGQSDWYRACQDIYGLLMAEGNKGSLVQFQEVSRYLETQYLQPREAGYQLDPVKAHEMIAAKARRLWEVTGRKDGANWSDAEAYVTEYYQHIIPAVTTGEDWHTRKVVDALQLRAARPELEPVVDCFEMSVAVNFLNSASVGRVLKAVAAGRGHAATGNAQLSLAS